MGLARQQFDGAHKGLKQTGFLKGYEWIQIKGMKHDWYIRYVPGERFFNEIKAAQDAIRKSPEPQKFSISKVAESGITFDECPLNEYHSNPQAGIDIEITPAWALFAGIVRQYPEFDLHDQDREWFRGRTQGIASCPSIDLMYEIQNWGDWLDLEHRKKTQNRHNRFPRSNFKGSLMNWLQHSLRAAGKGEIVVSASSIQNKPGRKGFDLPSDYPIDVM